MHRIGFYVCRGYDALDLAGPLSSFNQVATAAGHSPYELHVLSQAGGPVHGNTGLPIETRPIGRRAFDTVIFVGGDIAPMEEADNIAAARKLSARASRVASVCTGAFLLAATDLLNELRATTHWRYAAPTCNPASLASGSKATASTSRTGASGPRRASPPASTWRWR